MSKILEQAIVPEDWYGKRLDQALELLLPEAGLRERKRMWDRYAVLVDGRPRPKGFRVQTGQELSLRSLEIEVQDVPPLVPDGVRVVGQKSDFMAAVFKPSGVHCAAIAGRPGPSVEGALDTLWPGQHARLVNRLDLLTSGLVLVALTEDAHLGYRNNEDAGQVEKVYLALVLGEVAEPFTVSYALETADRKKVRVLSHDDDNPVRWTRVEPLRRFSDMGTTLVRVRISKGARHQIRAHLAASGYLIVGDPLYGVGEEGDRMYLHHFRTSLPKFEAKVIPDWPEWADWGLEKDSI
ncbi:pseudouridine synthase family protein [Desulfovibrio ferrophilus]|uniref:Pseudouridine synthase n=1 Tax=Desulfovibrio ferrophilus TaxID=241368 RepID=A0A2Z6AVT2_9BACT|nr:RluA family pseudouridine synthase [Desulfovibrio ferrophilus]BBD07328.1 pseudouridine synthase [Desulfovibrio ferrophilus]